MVGGLGDVFLSQMRASGLGRPAAPVASEWLHAHGADAPSGTGWTMEGVVLSTPNRTPQSRLLLVGAAEALGAVPKGTHHWDDFVTPDELASLLAAAGLTMGEPRGIAFSPTKGLHLSADMSLNYIVTATRNA